MNTFISTIKDKTRESQKKLFLLRKSSSLIETINDEQKGKKPSQVVKLNKEIKTIKNEIINDKMKRSKTSGQKFKKSVSFRNDLDIVEIMSIKHIKSAYKYKKGEEKIENNDEVDNNIKETKQKLLLNISFNHKTASTVGCCVCMIF